MNPVRCRLEPSTVGQARLLHVRASPRGPASESLAMADEFIDAYLTTHPGAPIDTWDLWADGALPSLGPATIGPADTPLRTGPDGEAEHGRAWREIGFAVDRFLAADGYLFSVPMWNAGIPYVLKQLIDVVSQPDHLFHFDPTTGYTGLLGDKKAVVLYTAGVYDPGRSRAFGRDFQASFLDDWLEWAGIKCRDAVYFRANLTSDDPASARLEAHIQARELGARF